MSMHFSANQFESNYKPSHLGSWNIPKSFQERPQQKKSITKPISNTSGHLLPTVKRDQKNIWKAVDIFNVDRKKSVEKKIRPETKQLRNRGGRGLIVQGSSAPRYAREPSPRAIVYEDRKNIEDGNNDSSQSDDAYESGDNQVIQALTRRNEALENARNNCSHRPLPREDLDYSWLQDESFENNILVTEKDKNHGYPTALTKRRVRKPDKEEMRGMILSKAQPRELSEIDFAIQWDLSPKRNPSRPRCNVYNYQQISTVLDHQKDSFLIKDEVSLEKLPNKTEKSYPQLLAPSFSPPKAFTYSNKSQNPDINESNNSLENKENIVRSLIEYSTQEIDDKGSISNRQSHSQRNLDKQIGFNDEAQECPSETINSQLPSKHWSKVNNMKDLNNCDLEYPTQKHEYEVLEYPLKMTDSLLPSNDCAKMYNTRNLSSINNYLLEYPSQKREDEIKNYPLRIVDSKFPLKNCANAYNTRNLSSLNKCLLEYPPQKREAEVAKILNLDVTDTEKADEPIDNTDNDSGLGRDLSVDDKDEKTVKGDSFITCDRSIKSPRRELHHTKRNCFACLAKTKDANKQPEISTKPSRSPSRPRKLLVFVDEHHKKEDGSKFRKSKPSIALEVIPGTPFGPKSFQDHKRLISTNQLAYKPFRAKKHRKIESVLVKQEKRVWK